jgi:GNAT superfamily N-acetyltransferase
MIRTGTSEDAKAVLELFCSIQELHATHFPDLFKMPSEAASPLEWLARVFAGLNAFVLVAEWDGAIVGNLLAQEIRREESVIQPALHYFSLEHIAVAKPFRRRGIGTALLSVLFEEAARRQINRIELQVWSFNDTGQQFFASHGFSAVNQRMAAVVGVPLPPPR